MFTCSVDQISRERWSVRVSTLFVPTHDWYSFKAQMIGQVSCSRENHCIWSGRKLPRRECKRIMCPSFQFLLFKLCPHRILTSIRPNVQRAFEFWYVQGGDFTKGGF